MSTAFHLPEKMQDAIHRIVSAIRGGSNDVAALSAFIEETKHLPLHNLDHYERAIRRSSSDIQQTPKRFFWQKQPDPIPWLDVFSGSGFQRERALRVIRAEAPSAFLLAVLIRRLNDWVPQVREAALGAVRHALATSSAETVAEVAWITLQVRSSWHRIDAQGDCLLANLLERPDVAAALSKRLLCASIGGASVVLREGGRGDSLDSFLTDLAKSARQPAVRAIAYRMLLTGRAMWPDGFKWRWIDKPMGNRVRERTYASREVTVEAEFLPTLMAALDDRSPSVRRVAADALIARRNDLGQTALTLAHQLEADMSPSVAERGRFILSKRL